MIPYSEKKIQLGKSIELGGRLVVAGYWVEGKWEVAVNGYRVSFWGNENVLKLYGGNSCTIL